MKKIFYKLKLMFYYLFRGMRIADEMILPTTKDDNGTHISSEENEEVDSVYNDLLRGEVTERVKELRYSMYAAERESYKYTYIGNGLARKKKGFFDYNGIYDESDGYPVILVQENKEDSTLEGEIESENRNFTIKIERDFLPSFRLEEFVKTLYVKDAYDGAVIIDFLISAHEKQFDRRSRMFLNRIKDIENGDLKNDIIDFNNISFVAYQAYGADDLTEFKFDNLVFVEIKRFMTDFYILKFRGNVVSKKEDLTKEFYNETQAQRYKNKEAKKQTKVDVDYFNAVEAWRNEKEKYDVDTAMRLSEELEKKKGE